MYNNKYFYMNYSAPLLTFIGTRFIAKKGYQRAFINAGGCFTGMLIAMGAEKLGSCLVKKIYKKKKR